MKTMNVTSLIIPCYNEADRLDTGKFISFLSDNKGIHIIFVNDGSKDDTLNVLNNIQKAAPENCTVLDMVQNGGKAEAVRQGVLLALNQYDHSHIGFLDADLATTLEEFSQMSEFIKRNSFYQAVVGSRMARLGANISRKLSRKVFSKVVGTMINAVSGLPINDTQCGAKIFSREMATRIFEAGFKTDWLFDVELFVRARQAFGKQYAARRMYEYPLMQWVNAEGSKVGLKEIYRTPIMIAKIGLLYNLPIEKMMSSLNNTWETMAHTMFSVNEWGTIA